MSRQGPDVYHTRRSRAIALLLFLVSAAACSREGGSGVVNPASLPTSETTVPLSELAPYFIAGEQITWSVTFLGVEGGRARMGVGSPGIINGKRVIAVSAQAESSGILAAVRRIRDSVESTIDLQTGLPVTTDSAVELKGKALIVKAVRRADGPVVDLLVTRSNGKEVKETRRLPSMETHDPLSAILLLRAWNAPAGTRANFQTLGGLRIWRTDLVVEGREEIDCPIGHRAAIRISGVSRRMNGNRPEKSSHPRTFTLWLSDDAQRIPLRIVATTEYGDISVNATSYDAPVSARR